MHGSFCFPTVFIAQHCNWPKSDSRLGVYSSTLDNPTSVGTSLGTSAVSRFVDSVHRKFTFTGSASTWQFKLTDSPSETMTVTGFDSLHTGASMRRMLTNCYKLFLTVLNKQTYILR